MNMDDILTADDPLYQKLYDIRDEAKSLGSLVETDFAPLLGKLREQAPVHKGYVRELLDLPVFHRLELIAGKSGYTVLSYDACEAVLRNNAVFSSTIAHSPNPGNEEKRSLMELDGERHRAYRRLLQPKFLESQANGWWRLRYIDDIVARLIGRLKGRKSAELNLDFCVRIPIYAITQAMGMEESDALAFREAHLRSMGLGVHSREERQDNDGKAEQMLLDLFARRRKDPADDLASFLLGASLQLPGETARPLTDREALHQARFVMFAGGGTTARQLGNLLWALLTHPDQLERLQNDRSLLDRAINEAIRWQPTSPLSNRLTLNDTTLFGIDIPKGSVVDICLDVANRDPTRWENPDDFDITRPVKHHLGLGIGQHRCLGINVAHAELSAALTALLDAFPRLRLDPDAEVPCLTGGIEQRGVSTLPVLLD